LLRSARNDGVETVRPTLGVIARLDRAIQYSETAVIESRSCGVLDSPPQCASAHKAGNDSCTWRTKSMPHTPSLRAQRSNPDCHRGKILDCFAALAMTMWRVRAPHFPLVPRTQRSVTSTVRCVRGLCGREQATRRGSRLCAATLRGVAARPGHETAPYPALSATIRATTRSRRMKWCQRAATT